MQWVVEQHFAELAAIIGIGQADQLAKAHAHLDGIRIGGKASHSQARSVLVEFDDDVDLLIPATIAAMELGEADDVSTVGSLLAHEDVEVRNACRMGLRFANISRVCSNLESLIDSNEIGNSVSLVDALAFHRRAANFDLEAGFADECTYVQECSFEAAGRISGVLDYHAFETGLKSKSPRIRSAAYKAACRTGLHQLPKACRSKAIEGECIESINFMGLLSNSNDWPLLQQLMKTPATTVAALSAIGKSGWVKLVPDLFDYLDSEEHCEHAALAFERITGLTVPRGEPREPPEDLDEDEKDFWVTTGLPETKIIRDWWQENSGVFDERHRYQEGHCVSQDPLPIIANQLSPLVALDAYLRERALNHRNTPDWELETWPKHWQTPGWAFS